MALAPSNQGAPFPLFWGPNFSRDGYLEVTLPETNVSPENRPVPDSYWKLSFSEAVFLLGRVLGVFVGSQLKFEKVSLKYEDVFMHCG